MTALWFLNDRHIPKEDGRVTGTGAISAWADAKTQPPISGLVRSPSGVDWQVGAVDELGHRLPLDVLYDVLYKEATQDEEGSEAGVARRPHDRASTRANAPAGTQTVPDGSDGAPGGNDSAPGGTGGTFNPGWPYDSGADASSNPRSTQPGDHASLGSPWSPRGVPFVEHRLGPDDGHTQNETTIDVDGNTVVAGWNQITDTSLVMGVGRSTDAGASWTSSELAGHDATSDPAVKAAGNGVWYYGYLARGGPGGNDIDIYVRRSTNDGATWSSPVDASQNTSFDDKPYIAARGNEVLVGWADFGSSPAKVRTARSTDGGVTFGANTILSVNSNSGNGACPVIAPDGDYFMFWRDSFQDSLWVTRSTNQGTSWAPDRGIVEMNPLPSSLPGGFRVVNLPSAAAHPLTGDLLVVWNDQAFGNPDILAIRSTDDGVTWSSPTRVNDDAGTAAQWFPWIDFDDAGIAHVVWYDRRNDSTNIDVYYARSSDGGQTFEPNVRITEQSFPPILPWDTSVDFIGDYNGIAVGASTVYPCYQDARRGEQDVYVALLPNDVTAVPDIVPPLTSRLMATPNPFRDRVSFRIAGPAAPSGGALQIFDAAGRLVRTLSFPGALDVTLRADVASSRLDAISDRSGHRDPNGHGDRGGLGDRGGRGDVVLDWDGQDDAGRPVPAGVYYGSVPDEPDAAGPDPVRVVRLHP